MLRQLRYFGGYFIRRKLRQKVSWFLQSTKNCQAVQAETLQRILALNAESHYSRRLSLTPSLTVEGFRQRANVSDFETIRAEIETMKQGHSQHLLGNRNPLLMFALSSGTTAESKFIPITSEFLKDYRRGWNLWGINAFDAHPSLHTRDIVQLSSNDDLFQTDGGTPCGNISGLVNKMQHPVVRTMYTVPYAVTKIKDAEAKLYTAVRLSVANPNVGLIMTANPSSLVQFAKFADSNQSDIIRDIADGTLKSSLVLPDETRAALKGRIHRPQRARARELERVIAETGHLYPRDYWPGLSLAAVWTGGSASAYLDTMRRFYGDVPIRDHGLSASEGRMTIPLEDGTSLGILDIHSHFFEFIPEAEYDSPTRTILQAHELQDGGSYYILLTTVSGLYRYDIRDVVRCRGFQGSTPLLEFLHKGASISNITGEKLTESQVVSSVNDAVRRLGLEFDYYTLSPVWGDPPRYRLHVEPSSFLQQLTLSRLATVVDEMLKKVNSEYDDKRHSGRLAPLECQSLPPGCWQRFVRHRQMQKGGSAEQYKHPCLVPSLQFSESLIRDFAEPVVEQTTKAA